MHPTLLLKPAAGLAIALAACLPLQARAQSSAGDGSWHFGGSIYGYLPTIGGSSKFPVDPAGTPIEIDAGKILDKLKFTFMGSLDVNNGRWGGFTDVLYLHLGDTKNQTRDFTIGNAGIPADTAADIDWNLEGLIWTTAGEYRLLSDPAFTLDALAGARLLNLKQTIKWNISGSLGPIAPAGRSGETSTTMSLWDAIIGVKGRYAINDRWSLPMYFDIGTGQSDLTVQAAAGVSYRYSWGELTAMYRYLGYEMKSGKALNDLNFKGPMIGATFRW